ncbi:MAG: hypothetical protein MRJ92_04180 [Nitrospira sp.]|nr:hypothetical protein [Nitrospira sp.]
MGIPIGQESPRSEIDPSSPPRWCSTFATDAMASADPAHATDYRTNATTYLQTLARVQDETLGLLKQLANRAGHRSSSGLAPISPSATYASRAPSSRNPRDLLHDTSIR